MGHELHLKGLPEDSDFFQLLKTSSDPGEFLSTLIRQTPLDPNPWILEDPDYMCEESRQLLRAYDAMRQSHSNLGTFYTGESGYIDSGFDLDRRYEILVYVLSEAFRRDRSYTGMATLVMGKHEFAFSGWQGHPVRWSSVADYAPLLERLYALSNDDLSRFYDPVRMYEMGVYKAVPDRSDDRHLRDLQRLKVFYRRLHDAGFAVVSLRG